jgi:hypothetical protein
MRLGLFMLLGFARYLKCLLRRVTRESQAVTGIEVPTDKFVAALCAMYGALCDFSLVFFDVRN